MNIDQPPLLTFPAPARTDTAEQRVQWITSVGSQIRIKVDTLLSGKSTVLVGVAGGSATGKTSLFSRIPFESYSPSVIHQDSYYVGNTAASRHGPPNVHDPSNYQINVIGEHLALLRSGMPIIKQKYSHSKREPEGEEIVQPASVVVLEGMYALLTSWRLTSTTAFSSIPMITAGLSAG